MVYTFKILDPLSPVGVDLERELLGGYSSLKSFLYSPENPVGISIDLVSSDSSVLERLPDPFLTEEEGELYRVLRGRLVVGGRPWKEVFLILDRDERPESLPLTNPEIEFLWQETWEGLRERPEVLGLADEEGKVRTLGPLIFCKRKREYFSPPCPDCGRPLELCLNEEKLRALGLASFGRSHKRYLFCPHCREREVFYVKTIKPGEDHPAVKDFKELVLSWTPLVEAHHLVSEFPCIGCPERKECYQVRGRALERLVPLAFYPFHLLIMEAYPLRAREFLQFLEEGRSGGEGPEMFFFSPEDPRKDLEVLYLKLAFLGTLAERFGGKEKASFRFEDLRVKPGVYEQMFLPSAWVFDITRLGLLRGPEDYPLPRPDNLSWFSLAIIWLEALSGLERDRLGEILRDLLAREISDLEEFRGFMAPYLPQISGEDRKALYLSEALYLGWQMLWASYQPGSLGDKEEILRPLKSLLERIREELWSRETPTVVEEARPSEEDQALANILRDIRERWQKELKPGPVVSERVETRVATASFNEEETLPFGTPQESLEPETIPETVILKPGESPGVAPEPSSPASKEAQRDLEEGLFLEETVILKGAPPDDKGK